MQTKNQDGMFNCLQNQMIAHKGQCRCEPNLHPINVIISNGIPDVLIGHYHRKRRTGEVRRIRSVLLKACINNRLWECIRIDREYPVAEPDARPANARLL